MMRSRYHFWARKYSLFVLSFSLWLCFSQVSLADSLADLARPHEGRSMRATSTHKIGPDGKYDPNGEPDPQSNRDNRSVPPGQTKVSMNVKGPGVITHICISEDTPYFYAQYRQEYPVRKGQDYVILETEGKGHYVGTVLSVRTRSPS